MKAAHVVPIYGKYFTRPTTIPNNIFKGFATW